MNFVLLEHVLIFISASMSIQPLNGMAALPFIFGWAFLTTLTDL